MTSLSNWEGLNDFVTIVLKPIVMKRKMMAGGMGEGGSKIVPYFDSSFMNEPLLSCNL